MRKKTNNPLISVIVPVYNVEKYLPRCIDSILAQTFKNFELLLIDDGSKDKSGEICDEYAKKDNRIKVFHKENGGVSSARNIGLDNANGEWICFCDADDMFYSEETFCINFEELCCIDIIEIPFFREYVKIRKVECLIKGYNNVKKYYANNFHNEVWARFYNKRLINSKRFLTALEIGEDVFFFLSLFNNINNIYISSRGGYLYIRNEHSVMFMADKEFENKQMKRYLSLIDNLKLNKEDIIGFYYNTAKYIWLNRKYFILEDFYFINYFNISKILTSDLTIRNKMEFLLLYFKFLFFI